MASVLASERTASDSNGTFGWSDIASKMSRDADMASALAVRGSNPIPEIVIFAGSFAKSKVSTEIGVSLPARFGLLSSRALVPVPG